MSRPTKASRVIELSSSPERTTNNPKKKSRLDREVSDSKSREFRLSIDFGTKFTSIACTKGKSDEIFTIEEFPDDPMPDKAGTQVPTEIAYFQGHTKGKGHQKKSRKILFGYEIQTYRDDPNHELRGFKEIGHISNIKLLLDKSPHLKDLRGTLIAMLKELKIHGVIVKDEDVIYDLLVCYLEHTKHILQRDYGLKATDDVEITFCTPVCWSPLANATMSACIQEAMKKINLGVSRSGVCNLFMVNEAEAAAMHALCSKINRFKWGEVFLLLDCGGGTTDVGVYEIGHEHPFRLGKEVAKTQGRVCGSGDLNCRFRKFAIEQLQNAQYPEKSKVTPENLVDLEVMPRFETRVKRAFSLKDEGKNRTYPFPLRGLKSSKVNSRFMTDVFVLSYKDMEGIFMPSLKTIADLMDIQINTALKNEARVDKVILVGGFGDSPALKDYIAKAIASINERKNTDIDLIVTPPNTGAAGVATGALRRAQDKENGPAKVPCQSIGFYHHVRNEPETYSKEVLEQTDDWELSEVDNEYYIRNTIQWIIKVGQGKFERVHDFKWEELHVFTPAHTRSWPVEYTLFASDECTEDFYQRSHLKNYGKTHMIGKVTFDLFPIRQQLTLIIAEDEEDGEDHYDVNVELQMRLIDKHLYFTAYWPSKVNAQFTIQGEHKHINVISAFRPGTA